MSKPLLASNLTESPDSFDETPAKNIATGDNRVALTYSKLALDWWLLEIGSILVSYACLAGIAIILIIYNGQPLPHWRFSITLNALIAFLSTIFKGSLLLAVSECLSQGKWLLLRKQQRKFETVDDFDRASRGVIGSLRLLSTLSFDFIGGLGSFIVLSSLLLALTTQQIVTYVPRFTTVVNQVATAPRSNSLRPPSEELSLSITDAQLTGAIYAGLFGANSSYNVIYPTCPSGICTWATEPYQSLGVTASFVEITNVAQVVCDTNKGSFVLEDGIPCSIAAKGQTLFNYTYGDSSLVKMVPMSPKDYDWFTILYPVFNNESDKMQKGDKLLSIGFPEVQHPMLNMWILCTSQNYSFYTAHQPGMFRLFETMLQYSLQTFQAEVSGGIPTINLIREELKDDWPINEPYNMTASNGEVLPYGCAGLIECFGPINALVELFSGNDSVTRLLNAKFELAGHSAQPSQAYANIMGNLAMTMSNEIRRRNNDPRGPLLGSVQRQTTVVHVSWLWLLYPTTLLLLSTILLITTMRHTRKAKLKAWKSSSWPLLMCYDKTDCDPGMPSSVAEVAAASGRLAVTLEYHSGSWSLRQRNTKSDKDI